MNRFYLGAIAAAVGLLACQGDPTASLRGGPADLHLSTDIMFLPLGDERKFEVAITDEQQNPLPATGVTAISGAPGFFTVVPDALPPTNLAVQTFVISSVALGAGQLTVNGLGLTGAATVVVVPKVFDGPVSDLATASGDTLVLRATADLEFDPSEVTVTFGDDDEVGTLLAVSADSVVVLVPYFSAAPAEIEGVILTYRPVVTMTLATAGVIAPSGDFWLGDDALGTAPALPVPGPGETAYAITTMSGVDNEATCPFGTPCLLYAFTLAQDTELNFLVDWTGDADIDIYMCPDADPDNCFEDGGAGATANHPEETQAVFSAGTHYLVIDAFDVPTTMPKNVRITISQPGPP